MLGFFLFGVELPLWALLIIGILVAIIAWKLIKFALKILLIVIIFFIILIAIDYLNIIGALQNFFTNVF